MVQLWVNIALFWGRSHFSWSLYDHELFQKLTVSRTLIYKDVEIVSVSLTEHHLLAKSLVKKAFLWLRCFLLV